MITSMLSYLLGLPSACSRQHLTLHCVFLLGMYYSRVGSLLVAQLILAAMASMTWQKLVDQPTDNLVRFIVGQGQLAWVVAATFLDQQKLCPALVKRTRFWDYVINLLLLLASALLSDFFLNGRFICLVPDLFREGRLEDTFPLMIEYRWRQGGKAGKLKERVVLCCP